MGPAKNENAGKAQSVPMTINPILVTRSRIPPHGAPITAVLWQIMTP
jgi:hypothetical protein